MLFFALLALVVHLQQVGDQLVSFFFGLVTFAVALKRTRFTVLPCTCCCSYISECYGFLPTGSVEVCRFLTGCSKFTMVVPVSGLGDAAIPCLTRMCD